MISPLWQPIGVQRRAVSPPERKLPLPPQRTRQPGCASIITTCKRRLDHLKRTLPAMLAQGAREVIVVAYDDEETANWSENWSEWEGQSTPIRVVRAEPLDPPYFNLSHARNVGAQAASGSVLAFIDADAILAEGWLVSCLDKLGGAVCVRSEIKGEDFHFSKSGTFAVRADAFHSIRGFDENIRGYYGDDVDFFRRVRGGTEHYDNRLVETIEHSDAERVKHYKTGKEASKSANKAYLKSRRGTVNPDGYGRAGKRLVLAAHSMNVGGAERVSIDIIDAMTEAGWRCTLTAPGGAWLHQTKADRVRTLDAPGLLADADALLINLSPDAYRMLPRIAREYPGVRRVGIVHDEHSLSAAFREFHPYLHTIITVSERLAERLIRDGVPDSKIVVRRWGVDTQRFRPDSGRALLERQRLGVAGDETLVLWCGRLAHGKRLVLAVEAMAHLPENVQLVMVGDGGEAVRADVEAAINRLGLRDQVALLGGVEDDRLPGLCVAANVALLTSKMEACPLVLQEAMACGVPVVASDVGAVHELVSPDCGVLIDSDRAEDFGAAILDVLRDCERMSAAARRRIVEHFNLTAVKREIVEVFERPRRSTAGVLTAASPEQWPHLLMLLESLRESNPALPVHVGAYRLSEEHRSELAKMGVGVTRFKDLGVPSDIMGDVPPPDLWMWVKPWTIQSSPFERTVWIDADAVVLRQFDDLLTAADASLVLTPDEHATIRPQGDGPKVNIGVMAWDMRREAPLMAAWIEQTIHRIRHSDWRKELLHYEQYTLREALLKTAHPYRIVEGWNEPPNGLIDRDIRSRHRYPCKGWLGGIKEDHPRAGIVHYPNGPKLPALLGARRFVLTFTGRCGSNMLRGAIDNHPQATCMDEVFNPLWEHQRAHHDYYRMGTRKFLKKHVWSWERENDRAIGFKHGFENLGREDLVKDRSLSVVLMRRENVLEMIASRWMAEMTGFWDAAEARPDWRVMTIPPTPPEVLALNMERLENWFDQLEREFSGHRHLKTTYEALTGPDAQAEWDQITSFLGLDPTPWNPPTVKPETRPMDKVFANFNELAKHFAGTRWGWMFESGATTPTS